MNYHTAITTSPDSTHHVGICIVRKREVRFVNPAFEKMFGYEPGTTKGENTSVFYVDSETYERVGQEANALIAARGIYSTDMMMRRKDGSLIWCNAVGQAIVSESPEGSSLWLFQEISGRKQAEEELRQARAAAEAARVAKNRFLSMMNHEIRTPMTACIGLIDLLQSTGLTPEQHEFADGAKSSGLELVSLLHDMLELSKLAADKIDFKLSDFDLRSVVSDVITPLSLQAEEKGLKFSCSIGASVPVALKGADDQLRQIISNLLGNAIKFTSEGSVSLSVRKEADDGQSVTLRFMVYDSGIGIAEDKVGRIFEPFTQADSSDTRLYNGAGLGLALCKGFVERMGGSIGVESVEGRGSTFWFTVALEKQMLSDHLNAWLPVEAGKAVESCAQRSACKDDGFISC